jgi:hypothetical protein
MTTYLAVKKGKTVYNINAVGVKQLMSYFFDKT